MGIYFKTQILADADETVKRLSTDLLHYFRELSSDRESIYIALSGGDTPQKLFKILANGFTELTDWKHLHFFWVDERCVPFSSDESNFGISDRLLFSKINIPRGNLHPIYGEEDPVVESARYADEIKAFLPYANGYPVFDVIILGMGEDGHAASIFPGQDFSPGPSSVCVVSSHPKTGQKRITLTGNTINNAKEIIFLVTGNKKAQPLKLIFEDSDEADIFPAKKIAPITGRLSWYLDKAAAAYIKGKI